MMCKVTPVILHGVLSPEAHDATRDLKSTLELATRISQVLQVLYTVTSSSGRTSIVKSRLPFWLIVSFKSVAEGLDIFRVCLVSSRGSWQLKGGLDTRVIHVLVSFRHATGGFSF